MAEVIFAVLVLGIGLILLLTAFPVGIIQGEKVKDASNASLIAQHAFDQITKVVAFYTQPDPAWVPPLNHPAPMTDYAGKPVTIGLLDGAMATDPANDAPVPDLRAKVLYPTWSANDSGGSTLSDGRPQDPSATNLLSELALGRAAGASFLDVWGYRFDRWSGSVPVWYENLQWVYPADRRYYWYAFYRQMHEGTYPLPVAADWVAQSTLLDRVRLDHITRRTYRVTVIVCKTPLEFTVGGRPHTQIEPPTWFSQRALGRADYAAQWTELAPIRLPAADGMAATFTLSGSTITDSAGGQLHAEIQAGRIKRGGIMLDGWGEIYRIVDVGPGGVQLDRAPSAVTIDRILPLWFNPNAIAAFPTIVTKQADLP